MLLLKLLVILVIVLIVFGTGRLPGIGGALGKGIRNFRQAMKESKEIDITPKKNQDKSGSG
jgi:sec-independent protein translocase protein TatA